MADKELVRLRSSLSELLSPAMVFPAARGTVADHDGPVDAGDVKGDAGQELKILSGPVFILIIIS